MGQFDDVVEEFGSGRQSGDADRGRGRARLILGKLFGGGSAPAPARPVPSQPIPTQASLPANPPAPSILERAERPHRQADGGRRRSAGQFLGRATDRTSPSSPASSAARSASNMLAELSKGPA